MNPFWMIASYAFALLGQLSDCWTTEVGLSHGLAEGNKIATWFTNKIGNTGLTLLKCIGLAQLFPVLAFEFAHQNVLAFVVPAVAVGVIGWVAGITNYLLLKKNKISL